MRVNSVSSPSFKASALEVMFAELKDSDLRDIAYQKAKQDTNDKRHNRIDNALYYSLPLVGGISILGGELPNVKPKYARGLKSLLVTSTTFKWAALFGLFDAARGTKHLLERKSETFNKFSENHPFLSNAAAVAVAIASWFGLRSGINGYAVKNAQKVLPYSTGKILVKINKALNNNKALNTLSETIAKIPSSAKAIGKGVLAFAPLIVLGTQILHSISHNQTKAKEYIKNYDELKASQEMVRANLVAEAEK